MVIKKIFFAYFIFISLSILKAEDYKVISPDGKAVFQLYYTPTSLSYSLDWQGESIADKSAIQFFTQPSYKLLGKENKEVKSSWKPVWGQFSTIEDRCNQLTLHLSINGVKTDLICRVYNDGIGVRFAVAEQNNLQDKTITYKLDLNTQAKADAYFIIRKHIIGPIKLRCLFPKDADKPRSQPLFLEYNEERHVSLLEFDLYTANLFNTA